MLNKTLAVFFRYSVGRVVAIHLKHLVLSRVDLPVHLHGEGVGVEADVEWLLDAVTVACDLFFCFCKRLSHVVVRLHRADWE